MAYMSQSKKVQIAPRVKAILKKYGLKGSLAVQNHSTLVLNIKSGKIDFVGNYNQVSERCNDGGRKADGYIQVNPYWYDEHFSGRAKQFIAEVIPAMNDGNHDNSDSMTDYFDVGWYIDVNVGRWDKPYVVEA